jgi:putative transposase
VTRAQRRRLVGLLVSAGDVWACVLEVNAWRRAHQDAALVSYQALCRELAAAGPGTFGDLDSTGARSVLRRYCDAWFAAAKRRKAGDTRARFPRRRRRMMPVRWYRGTFCLEGRRLRLPVARGRPPLVVRLDRDLPYPTGQIRSVTLLYDAGRLWVDVTAEVPVTVYPPRQGPDPARVAGVDLGIIHPYAVAGPAGQGLLVSGRAIRAEHRQHLADGRARRRAAARRAPRPGRVLSCPHCGCSGHRDLLAATTIAARAGGGTTAAVLPAAVTHRRAGTHLPECPRHDVTPGAAPIAAAPAGPLAGTGPPNPGPPSGPGQGVARPTTRNR